MLAPLSSKALRAAQAAAPSVPLEPHLRRLRAYLAVHDTGSVQRASEQMHVAQSALTRAVQELERPLGVSLFERTSRGMVSTEFGTILAERARRALDQLQQAQSELRPAVDGSAFVHRVTHRQLAALIGIADHHTESDAARQLSVSQPAVNMALRELERIVGEPLFRRSPRGMVPTWAGEVLVRRAKLAFSEIAAAQSDIAARAGVIGGRVVIGALPLSGSLLTPRAVQLLLREHPNMAVSIVDGTYRALLQGLLCGDIDVIVGGLKVPVPPEIVQEELFVDELCCVVRVGHPLARARRMGPAALAGREWVLPRIGTPARTRVDAILSTLGLDVGVNPIEANSLTVVRALLLESDRVAVLSRQQALFDAAAGLLAVLPVELPCNGMPIGIRTRAGAALPVGVQVLVGCLRQVAAEMAR